MPGDLDRRLHSASSRLRLDLLVSPGFLIALGVLVVNDAVLKARYHNAITGKLSDFAGLFAFAILGNAFSPRRPLSLYLGTALAFALWKSPLADGFIAFVSQWWPIGRVVDWTDLVALAVLPLAWVYVGRARAITLLRPLRYLSLAGTFVAFAATSPAREHFEDDTTYVVPVDRRELLPALKRLGDSDSSFSMWYSNGASGDEVQFSLHVDPARHWPIDLVVEIRPTATGETLLTIKRVTIVKGEPESLATVHDRFLAAIVTPLRQHKPPQNPTAPPTRPPAPTHESV